jgi:hypothetical protein
VVATVVAKTAAVVSITATTAVRVAAAGRVLKGIVARNYLETAAAGHQAAVAVIQPQVLVEATVRMVVQVETVLTFPLFWVRHLVRLSWLAVAEAVVRLLRVLTAQVVWVVRAVVATVLETQTLPTPLRSALAEVGQVTMATTLFILAATVLTVSHT